MGTFERFTTKTHFNTLKRLVVLAGVAVLAVKLLLFRLGDRGYACPPPSPRGSARCH